MNASQIADKRFGQNFLKDRSIINEIIQSMPGDDLPIVEIGPGLGDLTRELVRVRQVTAYEVDKRLCAYLRDAFSKETASERLRLECGDVLERWKGESLSGRPYHLVANLPYYIATAIIIKAMRDPHCRSILTMVQKEVAEKFAADVAEKQFCALSVLTHSIGKAEILFSVPPAAFVPPPKVVSAVLSVKKHGTLEDRGFEEFLRIAFRHPRKKLAGNLAGRFGKEKVDRCYQDLGLEHNLRPHEVGTVLYHQLYNVLTKEPNHGKKTESFRRKQKSTQR